MIGVCTYCEEETELKLAVSETVQLVTTEIKGSL